MSSDRDVLVDVYESIDEQHRHLPATTRRRLIAGTAATLGGMGALGMASSAFAQTNAPSGPNTPENILNIAATAEVLATIVNTVGAERVTGLDAVTQRNVRAAAREELIHYQVLTGPLNAKPVTKQIHVPDDAFASATGLLTTLAVGDQIFINAYLLGTTVFARMGGSKGGKFARVAAEFMGVEAVHRALALQSLGKLGNDRVFMRFAEKEETTGLPSTGTPGFYAITDAVAQLEAAGFGFGKPGSKPGQMYDFDTVSARTPDDPDLVTRSIS